MDIKIKMSYNFNKINDDIHYICINKGIREWVRIVLSKGLQY